MKFWGDRALGMSWFPTKFCKRKWEYLATYVRLGTKEYFLLYSLPQKTKCKHVPVRAIPKQALNELTLELEAIKLLQTEVTPELIAQVQCYASEVTLLQVIVNLPAQGCLTYCFIVIFRHNSNESSKKPENIRTEVLSVILYRHLWYVHCSSILNCAATVYYFCGITASFTEHTWCLCLSCTVNWVI